LPAPEQPTVITQLNVTYVAEEDRVLFRFNTHDGQEFRLWLTRATVRQLLAVGAQASVLAHAAQHALPQAQAIAEDVCAARKPVAADLGDGHLAACHMATPDSGHSKAGAILEVVV
jgi:hypothetical protein